MKKFRLLLLDANVVIVLCKLGLWDLVLEKCEVLLARTVLEDEAVFFEDKYGDRKYLDFSEDVRTNRLTVIEASPSQVRAFLNRFKPYYLGEIDPGEAESLTHLVNANEEHRICSADKIVFRVLGCLGLGEQSVSLEVLIKQIGLSATLAEEFSESYKIKWTKIGQQEGIQGRALR